jgi:hypothetical protein
VGAGIFKSFFANVGSIGFSGSGPPASGNTTFGRCDTTGGGAGIVRSLRAAVNSIFFSGGGGGGAGSASFVSGAGWAAGIRGFGRGAASVI